MLNSEANCRGNALGSDNVRYGAILAWAAVLLGLIGWLGLGLTGWLVMPAHPLAARVTLHGLVLPLPGFLLALGLVFVRVKTSDAPDVAASGALLERNLGVVLAVLTGGLVAALLIGMSRDLSAIKAAALMVCGVLTLLMAIFALTSLTPDEGLWFDSHWGGLGGGMGGWRVSRQAVLVFLLLVFASATVAIAVWDGAPLRNTTTQGSPGASPPPAALPKAPVPAPQAPGPQPILPPGAAPRVIAPSAAAPAAPDGSRLQPIKPAA